MSRAIAIKTLRESAGLLAILLAGIVAFEMLFVRAMTEFGGDLLEFWSRRPVLKSFVQVLVGSEFGAEVSTTSLVTIGLAHPVLLTLVWIFVLSQGSRAVAGEVDRGTADLLLALPVSRARVFASASLVIVAAGVLLCAAPLLGMWLAQWLHVVRQPLELHRLVVPSVNFFALYVAVCGAALCASAASARRGPAIAIVLAALLASFLVNFLAPLWSAVERISFLGILHYYRPLAIVQRGEWPVYDLGVLVCGGAALWLAGLWTFTRRDVPAA